MNHELWVMTGWLVAASVLGFGISALFAGVLRLERRRFLVPYVGLVSLFLYGFTALNEIDCVSLLTTNGWWGILAGTLVSLFLVKTVREQPRSRHLSGRALVFDIGWAGLLYGLIDAMFLNVTPVVAVWLGASSFSWTASPVGKVLVGAAGLFASLLVTLAYHLGYPEFRNKKVAMVLMGNSVITLAFILSSNPLGSIISHTAMHIAAVLQGAETTIQLPPHYQARAGNVS
jgi:hypothetical protein